MKKVLLLLIISLISVLMIGCTGVSKDIDAPNASLETEVDGVTGIRLSATRKNSMSDSESEISTAAILTTTVTATIEGSGELTWSLSCPSSSSLVIANYVTMSVSDDTLSVDISCSKAFGQQIVLRATSASNSEIYAECTIDYAKRIRNIGVTNVSCNNADSIGATLTVTDIVNESNFTIYYNTITDGTTGIFCYETIFTYNVALAIGNVNSNVTTGSLAVTPKVVHSVRLSDELKAAFSSAGLSFNTNSLNNANGRSILIWLQQLTLIRATAYRSAVLDVLASVDCWFVYRIACSVTTDFDTYTYYEDFKLTGFDISDGKAAGAW